MDQPVYLSLDDIAVWQADVEDCPDCQARGDEEVCSEHDLNDENVALRYSGAAG